MNISERTGIGLLLGSAVISVALCVGLYVVTPGRGVWYASLWSPVFFAVLAVMVFFSCRKHFRKPAAWRKKPDLAPLMLSFFWLFLVLHAFLAGTCLVAPLFARMELIIPVVLLIGFLVLMKSARNGGRPA